MITYKGKTYYYTGNYGMLGTDRYFTMIGRASRFYITYTLNKVYCELVQSVVGAIDVVEECAVVPKPDRDDLFISKAFIVLKSGVTPSDELRDYIVRKAREPFKNPATGEDLSLKDYELPKSISFVSELPRNQSSGKIDCRALEEQAAKEM